MDLITTKKRVLEKVQQQKQELINIAVELFQNPETGLQEHNAAKLLCNFLGGEGFLVERGLAGLPTAFRASFGSSGPRIAILAEMDALPEIGHACGHNIIAACAVGAASVLRQVVPDNACRIIVLGTPAEEMGIGKIEMIKAGCFADVDFAMMVHPSSKRQVIKKFLGLAKLNFLFLGQPAHAAAYPEEGVNALDAVIQTFNSINALRQQLRQDVRVHGIITDGGMAPNIIPARAACRFYVRADDLSEVIKVKERLIACAKGASTATGCGLEIEEDKRILAPLKINYRFSDLYSEQLRFLGLAESHFPPDLNKGSSDIGNVSQVVPTIHPHVPIGVGIHIHSADFAKATISRQGEEAVLEGAIALALTAVELISSSEIRESILSEFNQS